MAFDNSNDKNDLKLVRIDKKDSIGAFVEKCNYNFNQLLMHGGGVPGKDGIDGDRGAVGLSRNPIHVISDQLGLTNIDDVNAYLNDVLSNLEDLKVGDIILWNGGLYIILDDFPEHCQQRIQKRGDSLDEEFHTLEDLEYYRKSFMLLYNSLQ